nr:hypothetical protein [Mucilaginibacter sp. FT3.2]
MICGLDACSVQLDVGVPPYHVIQVFDGHYQHCMNTMDQTKNCNSSECDAPCDAKKPIL